MLQHLSLARGGVIISLQFSVSCTGYQSASESISRLPAGFSRHCTDRQSTRLHRRGLPPDIRLGPSQTPLFRHQNLCHLPPFRTATRFGDRSFSADGPPVLGPVRAPELTFDRFKRGLKTYLFTLVWWDLSAYWLLIFGARRYINSLYACMCVLAKFKQRIREILKSEKLKSVASSIPEILKGV